jgi:DNA primase
MRLDGLTFPQAARVLAERAGVEVPESDAPDDIEQRRERQRNERLCALMEVATQFYATQLVEHPLAKHAQAELEQRGVQPEVAASFRLGYAPHAWDALARHLEEREYSIDDAVLLGLVAPRRNAGNVGNAASSSNGRNTGRSGAAGGNHYDRFRHRLMFPVTDLSGRVVAFSGRLLPELEPQNPAAGPAPKYVNSPESPIYKKGEQLFGLHAARVEIRRHGWAVLCEGNFDLVALHQAGVQNAVAPLGTAFTQTQARLLRRFAQRVTLMFDGDAAGAKAAHAAYPLLRAVDLTGRVVRLPPGEDPDTYLRKHGVDALRRLLDGAVGLMEYLIDQAAEAAGPGAAARAAAIESLGPVVAACGNPVEIELYIERIAQRFSLTDLRVVKEQLRRGVRAARPDARVDARRPVSETKVAVSKERVKLPQLALQQTLLGALLDKPELFRSAHAQHLKELLTAEDLQAIFSAAAAQVEDTGALDATKLLLDLPLSELPGSEAADWLRERLSVETYSDHARAEEVLRKGIPLLEKHRIERDRAELATRIQLARQHGDETLAVALTRERDAIRFKW